STWFAETDWTIPSFVTPLTVNWTRVVEGVPKNRPPFKVSVVPPSLGPKLGLQEATNGPVPVADWKMIVKVAEPVFAPTVAVALTLAVPAPGPHRAVTAAPFWVLTVTRGRPLCENVPKSDEKLTPVPSGTGFPFSVTIASTSVQVPALGLASLATSWIWSAPVPPPGWGLGADGASAAQALSPRAATTSVRAMAIRRMDPPYRAACADPANPSKRKMRIPLAVWLCTRWPETVLPKNVMLNFMSISSFPVSRSIPPLNGSSW